MDITRGNLDDISRPASSERSRPGSRVSSVLLPESGGRSCPTSPMSLVVLSNDTSDIKDRSIDSRGNCQDGSHTSDTDPSLADMSEEESEDAELRKAIRKMKRLDKVLASRMSNEKEIKLRGKELHQKLWHELLQIKPKRSSECSDEAENTRLFLSLTPTNGETEHILKSRSPSVGQEERGPDHSEESQCVPRSKKKQDFVKKNIELASGAGSQVTLTQEENNRLAELLRDIEEEQGDSARTATCEVEEWVVRVPAGEGYTPEPTVLDQLMFIQSRLQLLLPAEEFLSARSPCSNRNSLQGLDSGWDSGGDTQPGEKVLQDIRERRGQERRLQEIQQQLETLAQDQELTSEAPILMEDQLRSLLEECELAQSRSCSLGTGTEAGDTSLEDSSDTDSLLGSSPHLSDSLLSELLRDSYTTSFSQLEAGTTTG